MRRAAVAIGGLAALAGAVIYLFPLELAELSNRYEYWREGVTDVRSGGLHALLSDHCQGKRPDECTCVAMIHGLADTAGTWKKVLFWPANGWLKPFKLYAFDLPGSGRSPAPADPAQGYRVRNQARTLRDAMQPLCAKWMVVGNSLGGWIAAWLALDWPEGVSKVILADSAGLKAGASDPRELEAFTHPTVELLKEFQRKAYFSPRPLPDHVWRAAVERMKSSDARAVLAAQTPDDYLDGRVAAVRRPVLLLWGQADQLTPMALGKALKDQIPGSVWMELPQCGHMPQKECPLEVIRAIGRMADFGAI
jgi:pimeloyl-ACP methyl ester carboxylesterase